MEAIDHVKYQMANPEIQILIIKTVISNLIIVGLIFSGTAAAEFTQKCSSLMEVNTLPPCSVMGSKLLRKFGERLCLVVVHKDLFSIRGTFTLQHTTKRDEIQKKELMKAIENINRSFEEIMQFLQVDALAERSENVEI